MRELGLGQGRILRVTMNNNNHLVAGASPTTGYLAASFGVLGIRFHHRVLGMLGQDACKVSGWKWNTNLDFLGRQLGRADRQLLGSCWGLTSALRSWGCCLQRGGRRPRLGGLLRFRGFSGGQPSFRLQEELFNLAVRQADDRLVCGDGHGVLCWAAEKRGCANAQVSTTAQQMESGKKKP